MHVPGGDLWHQKPRQRQSSEARRHDETTTSTEAAAPSPPILCDIPAAFTDYTYTPRLRGDVRAVGRAIPRGRRLAGVSIHPARRGGTCRWSNPPTASSQGLTVCCCGLVSIIRPRAGTVRCHRQAPSAGETAQGSLVCLPTHGSPPSGPTNHRVDARSPGLLPRKPGKPRGWRHLRGHLTSVECPCE